MRRRQLIDAQWKFIEPYLSIGRSGPYSERDSRSRPRLRLRLGTAIKTPTGELHDPYGR
ncbi:hypothetical protein [Streptomyces sp. C10-9-1]|uniref:hypothetical protein n=1 Tax=Streptomyces sp. C10-9-1 TaxID=1859285 RepID=UPI003D717DDF